MYQSRVACNIRRDASCLRCGFQQVVAVNQGVHGDFGIIAVSTRIEQTFVIWVFAGIEDVIAVLTGTERGHGGHRRYRLQSFENSPSGP